MLRLHERHEKYCEAGIMAELPDFDDFHMAAISWVVAREWDNPLLSDQVKVSSYRVSHNIGPTLFFAILSVSTLPKYKNLVSVKKFRKFAIR